MNRKNKYLIIGIIIVLVITILTTSYSLLKINDEIGKQQLIAGIFNVTFKDGDTITMENSAPTTDVEGLKTKPYDIEIKNIGNVNSVYTLRLEEDKTIPKEKRLNTSWIKYSIKIGKDDWTKPDLLSNLYNQVLIKEKKLKAKENNKINCSIKLWIDENVGNEGQNKIYKARLVLEAVQDNN